VNSIPVENRVYVDESGVARPFIRERGRALRGVKIQDAKRGRRFQRTNVVAGKIGSKIVAPLCYTAHMTKKLFAEWFQKELVEAIPKGSTVIMDNASFHSKPALQNIANQYEINLLFLPSYSPDFNPIEKTWANMKRALIEMLTYEKNLENAILRYLKEREYLS
jgi:Transposase and inactivated derivatives